MLRVSPEPFSHRLCSGDLPVPPVEIPIRYAAVLIGLASESHDSPKLPHSVSYRSSREIHRCVLRSTGPTSDHIHRVGKSLSWFLNAMQNLVIPASTITPPISLTAHGNLHAPQVEILQAGRPPSDRGCEIAANDLHAWNPNAGFH